MPKRSINLARQLDHPHHRIDIQLAIQMRKQLARHLTMLACRLLKLQHGFQPRLIDTQNNRLAVSTTCASVEQ